MNEEEFKGLLKNILQSEDNHIQYREDFIMVIDCIVFYYLELLKRNPYDAYWSDEADMQDEDEEKVTEDYEWLYSYENIFWKESDNVSKNMSTYSFLSKAKMSKGPKEKKKFQNPLGWNYEIDEYKYKVKLPNNSYGPYHIMFLTDMNFISLFSKWDKNVAEPKYYDDALKYGEKLQEYQNGDKYNEDKDGKYNGLLYEKMLGVNLVNLIANYMRYIFEDLRPCAKGDGYYSFPEWRKEEKEKHRDKMEKRIIDFMGLTLDEMKDLGVLTKLILVHIGLYEVCYDAKNYAEDLFNIMHMDDMDDMDTPYDSPYDCTRTYHTAIYNSLRRNFGNNKQWVVRQKEIEEIFDDFKIERGFIERLNEFDEFVAVCQKILSNDELDLLTNSIKLVPIYK